MHNKITMKMQICQAENEFFKHEFKDISKFLKKHSPPPSLSKRKLKYNPLLNSPTFYRISVLQGQRKAPNHKKLAAYYRKDYILPEWIWFSSPKILNYHKSNNNTGNIRNVYFCIDVS